MRNESVFILKEFWTLNRSDNLTLQIWNELTNLTKNDHKNESSIVDTKNVG